MSTPKENILSKMLQPAGVGAGQVKAGSVLIQEVDKCEDLSPATTTPSDSGNLIPNETSANDTAKLDISPGNGDEEPSLLEMMMAAQQEAKAEKVSKETAENKKGLGGGFKKGFLGGGGASTNKKKQSSASNPSPNRSSNIVEVKSSAAGKGRTGGSNGTSKEGNNNLVFDDVQKAMEEDQHPLLKQLKQNDWMTPDLATKVQSSSILTRGFKDPKCMAAMQLMQQDPQAAMKRFQGDSTVTSFLQEFGKLMAEHFEQLGAKQQQQQEQQGVSGNNSGNNSGTSGGGGRIQEIGPLQAKAIQNKKKQSAEEESKKPPSVSSLMVEKSTTKKGPTAGNITTGTSSKLSDTGSAAAAAATGTTTVEGSAADDAKVQQILQDEELRGMLMDPELQKVLMECGDPRKFQQHMRDPNTARKIMRLQQAGLVGTAR